MQTRRRNNNLIMVVLFVAGLLAVIFKSAPRKSMVSTEHMAPIQGEVEQKQISAAKTEKPNPVEQVSRPEKAKVQNPSMAKPQQKVLTRDEIQQLRGILKSSLVSAFTAQRALMAEWDRYSTDFVMMGWAPRPPEMNFKIGFLEPFQPNRDNGNLVPDEAPERMSTDAVIGRSEVDSKGQEVFFSYSEDAAQIHLEDYRKLCEEGCTAKNKSFEMIAVLPLGNGRYDVWTINSRKMITQVQDGLRTPAQE